MCFNLRVNFIIIEETLEALVLDKSITYRLLVPGNTYYSSFGFLISENR